MPLYEYECRYCEHEFVDFKKVSEREVPLHEPCPECLAAGGVFKKLSSALITAGSGAFHSKIPDFFKDRLKDIKKQSGRGCTIDV